MGLSITEMKVQGMLRDGVESLESIARSLKKIEKHLEIIASKNNDENDEEDAEELEEAIDLTADIILKKGESN